MTRTREMTEPREPSRPRSARAWLATGVCSASPWDLREALRSARLRAMGPRHVGVGRRTALLVALAAAASGLAGCACGLERAESARSRSFVLRSLGRRTADDAENTARTVTMLHCTLAEAWRNSMRDLATTCELYDGRR